MITILWGMSSGEGEPAMDFELEAYHWKHRVLIIFAESKERPRFVAQMRFLKNEWDGVLDRDLIIVEVPEKGKSRCGDLIISVDTAEALRKRFQVNAGTFQVLLIGKDGGVKLRAEEPVHTKDLFNLIDAMPMRREEMRRKR
jgi:hypothetical protein